MDLLDLTLEAHGGLERWRDLTTARAHVRAAGGLWKLKRQEGVLADTDVTVDLTTQRTTHEPFAEPGLRSVFTTDHVAVETTDGRVVEERDRPRDAFAGHDRDTPWDHLHVVHFAGYAMWTYLTSPFVFTEPGFETREIDPWDEDGETWRRLEVTFPGHIATHCPVQIFHIDARYLIRRHDYTAEVVGGGPAAHYSDEHRTFDGIVVPTRRRVHPVDRLGRSRSDITMVALDLDDVAFT